MFLKFLFLICYENNLVCIRAGYACLLSDIFYVVESFIAEECHWARINSRHTVGLKNIGRIAVYGIRSLLLGSPRLCGYPTEERTLTRAEVTL